jgi:EmrB/QacA subfamily drug resistance transporter
METINIRTTRPAWTLAIASVGAFMTAVDMMVVTTALPVLHRDLGASVGDLEWTMNAYNLAFACMLLTAAGLGDRFGRRRTFGIGLASFGVASALAALAPGIDALIAARAAQGAGAALILPLTLTIISEAYPVERRGKALGIWSAVTGLGGILGPILGGVIVQGVGWQWIFWVNVPIALALVAAARWAISETYGPRHRLDAPGLALATAGLFSLCWGLVASTTHPWASIHVVPPLAVGAAGLAAFLARERATAAPLMPLELFRIRSFSATNVVASCTYGSAMGGVFLMSQYFQLVQHHDPVGAALRFIPWTLPIPFVAPIAGTLAQRYGNKPLITGGMALQTIALGWFTAVVDANAPYVELFGPLVLSGVGISLTFPAMSSEVVAAVRPEQMGIASGVNSAVREVGGVFGVAIIATVFASSGSYATTHAFMHGFTAALLIATIIVAVGTVAATLTGTRPRQMSQPSLNSDIEGRQISDTVSYT